jgi:hypothetical protein
VNQTTQEHVNTQTEQDRVEARNKRIAALPKQIAEDRNNAVIISDVKQGLYNPDPVELDPMLPAVVLATPSPKLNRVAYSNDSIKRDEVIGVFCGSPVYLLDEDSAEAHAAAYDALVVEPIEAELREEEWKARTALLLLPGEERCADGIIRRTTTAEALGYDDYHNALLEEKPREELVEEVGTPHWVWWNDVEQGLTSGRYTFDTVPRFVEMEEQGERSVVV